MNVFAVLMYACFICVGSGGCRKIFSLTFSQFCLSTGVILEVVVGGKIAAPGFFRVPWSFAHFSQSYFLLLTRIKVIP